MLSTTAQYALRALALLAREPRGAATLGRDLARAGDIPENYLSKLLWQLKNAGLITATRGSRGGYKLAKAAGQIRLIDIVEVFDALGVRPSCLMGQGECNEQHACSAHDAWKKVRDVYVDFLQSNTLADISGRSSPVVRAAALGEEASS